MSANLRSLILIALVSGSVSPGFGSEPEIRIGVVAFEDFAQETRRWQTVFREFPGQPQPRFRVAIGTYGDLLHWMRSGVIDVGVLTSGVFAEALATGLVATEDAPAGAFEYVATVGLPPATSEWAAQDRRRPGRHFRYRSVAVVAADSSLRTVEDLLAPTAEPEFVFVHPLSVSGCVVPESVLRGLGVRPRREQVRFSFSHTNSLRLVAERPKGTERMAFVWDDALRTAPELAPELRRIPIDELQKLEIAHDVVVVRGDHRAAASVHAFLTSHVDGNGAPDFRKLEDWESRYGRIGGWIESLRTSAHHEAVRTVTLDEIGQILLHGARSRPQPVRLAVVFSGGGAKCSYQVGAVSAIEEKLADLRQRYAEEELDISLVIGTSGGAMNALPVALGVTSSAEGRAAFAETWRKLDQRRLVRPSPLFGANIGVWFALLATVLVLLLVRLAVRRERQGWWWGGALLAMGLGVLVSGAFEYEPWELLGNNHVLHHAWLWVSFGARAFTWSSLLLGCSFLVLRWSNPGFPQRRSRLLWPIVACLAVLPLIQVVTVLLLQKTLSAGAGIEAVLAHEFPSLIDGTLDRGGETPLVVDPGAANAVRLREASREIVGRKLVRRDLVITGNAIHHSSESLPSDLYFFLAGESGVSPPRGPRWIPLEQHPSRLMDVVMGSGTIFPVFPPRSLVDFPGAGERVELVDGGFAHNSPIEAAVLWGATHVVVIEATPDERKPQKNLLQNSAVAFEHLYKQAQLVDARSKRHVMVFTLAPDPPHLCVMDFAGNLVGASIRRGYEDAVGIGGLPKFHKELSEPAFADLIDSGPSLGVRARTTR